MKLVTVQVVVADDARASAIAEYLRGAAASITRSGQDQDANAVRARIDQALNPPMADVPTSADGGQLFDRVTGEEVVGRALSIPAISGFSTAQQGPARIELRGEHVYEVFEERTSYDEDPGTSSAIYVTVTGRRIPEDRVIVRTEAALAAGEV